VWHDRQMAPVGRTQRCHALWGPVGVEWVLLCAGAAVVHVAQRGQAVFRNHVQVLGRGEKQPPFSVSCPDPCVTAAVIKVVLVANRPRAKQWYGLQHSCTMILAQLH
jgi:hypothetical protein